MFTTLTKNRLLDRFFGKRAWTSKPDTFYIGAFTQGPDGNGENFVEVTGPGYARRAVPANADNWGDKDGGGALANGRSLLYGMTNKTQIAWNQATGGWGTVVEIGLFTAARGGQLLASVPLESAIDMPAFATLRIAAGGLQFVLSGVFLPVAGDLVLNWLFRGAAMGEPTNFHLALGNGGGLTVNAPVAPSTIETVTFVDFAELAENNYERRSIPNTIGRWPISVDGVKRLAGTTLNFKVAQTANWTDASSWVLFDAATAGFPLFAAALDLPLQVAVGDVVQVPAESIRFTFE
jgi:hypothetical protein